MFLVVNKSFQATISSNSFRTTFTCAMSSGSGGHVTSSAWIPRKTRVIDAFSVKYSSSAHEV